MDSLDRTLLIEATMKVVNHVDTIMRGGSAADIVRALTDPEIRHHVQTILDLEPTRRR